MLPLIGSEHAVSTPARGAADSGEILVRRAMLDTFLKPVQRYLQGDITEIAINRPGEIWTEGPGGWRGHQAPELTYQSCLHIAQLIATYNEKDISIDRPILLDLLRRTNVCFQIARRYANVAAYIKKTDK